MPPRAVTLNQTFKHLNATLIPGSAREELDLVIARSRFSFLLKDSDGYFFECIGNDDYICFGIIDAYFVEVFKSNFPVSKQLTLALTAKGYHILTRIHFLTAIMTAMELFSPIF